MLQSSHLSVWAMVASSSQISYEEKAIRLTCELSVVPKVQL
jgi:hypothetical protein